jgi:hypothetical protein
MKGTCTNKRESGVQVIGPIALDTKDRARHYLTVENQAPTPSRASSFSPNPLPQGRDSPQGRPKSSNCDPGRSGGGGGLCKWNGSVIQYLR